MAKDFRQKNDKWQVLPGDKISQKRFALIVLWFFCYMAAFFFLEERTFVDWNIISSQLDALIPFTPEFIYIYIFWFPYVGCLFIWFSCINRSENAGKITKLMLAGTTLFLLISWIYPTGLNFRQYIFYEQGTLTGFLVQILHRIDTPTNVFPSMHVFMTLAVQIGLEHETKIKNRRSLLWVTRIIAVLIVLSTVFLKQHSVIDVCGGILLAALLYVKFYVLDEQKRLRQS